MLKRCLGAALLTFAPLALAQFPDQADHDDRAVPAGRRGRHRRASGGRGDEPRPEAAGRRSRTSRAPAAASAWRRSAKAKPDGYTILLSLASLTVLPEADKILGRAPMYQLDQLKPIARFTADPTVFVVRAEAPWKTLPDFIADARANPGKFTYGSSGNYGTMHVPMEMFAGAAGVKMVARAVHRRGSGHRRACSAGRSTRSRPARRRSSSRSRPARCARSRNGATSGSSRCPTCRASRKPAPTSNTRSGRVCSFPPARPTPVVQRLREAARAAANDARVKEVLLTAGSPVQYLDAPEFQRYVDADAAKMADVVKRIGKVESESEAPPSAREVRAARR